ncbi:hypothetical protein SAMN04487914_15117 [Arthrobacter sp. ok909]|jgi:hypothetical protein|nr:hypothetical protein SAMN04487914_15117 [Arthrobacter sp. ok909]
MPPFALSGIRVQTVLPPLPALLRARANNPETWDALMCELDADFT